MGNTMMAKLLSSCEICKTRIIPKELAINLTEHVLILLKQLKNAIILLKIVRLYTSLSAFS